ncbi:MAG TPA: DUF2520 domain-containing protein [Thermoanaerobaculia bacterium]|jgi:predicted short-subunit dehydrogenase-like oxidoreductase (DUF2520 family)|nr:DUF2520 domain-containing protein [Thermoanaerobaculia bacterium]
MSAPLAGLRFCLAGPGKVGSSLAGWAVAAGAELVAVAGRGALAELASGGLDLLLLALPDAALAAAAAELARRPQAAVALHTSGSLDASVLAPLRAAGSAVGSLHPLKAFPEPLPDPAEARGVFFAVDGDPTARELAARLATAWEGVAGEVPPAARPLYHFAATLAAGGVVTLLSVAGELGERLGLPSAVTRGYLELARGAVAAAGQGLDAGRPLAAAITGPVARGDAAALRRQLAALRVSAADKLPLARALAAETAHQRQGLGEELSALLSTLKTEPEEPRN